MQVRIYKETVENALQERKKRGWDKIYDEMSLKGFWCHNLDIQTKAFVVGNTLWCFACNRENVYHSLESEEGTWAEFRDRTLLGCRRKNLEKWAKQKFNKTFRELREWHRQKWYKQNGVLFKKYNGAILWD